MPKTHDAGPVLSQPSEAAAVVDLVRPGGNVIVPLANGEPVAVLDALEAAAANGTLEGVRVHQMHALHDRPYLAGRTATVATTSATSCRT